MKLSVIMTIEQNTGIMKSIESVLRQNEQDYELLLIGKDLDDRSLAYCQILAEQYPNIHVWCDSDTTSCIENIGMEHALGDYLLFMHDGDEFISEDAFHSLMSAMKQAVDVILYSYEVLCKETGKIQVKSLMDVDSHQTLGSVFSQMKDEGVFDFNVSLFCFRRSLLEKYQLKFYIGITWKDIYFILQTCTYLHNYVILREPIYRYVKYKNLDGTHYIDMLLLLDIFKLECKIMEYDMKQFVMEYLASLYVSVLIATKNNKEDSWIQLHEYLYILSYHHNVAVRKIGDFHMLCGLKSTAFALKVYNKLQDGISIGGLYGKGSDLYY